jgi:uroporphyrinogen decarboxylase
MAGSNLSHRERMETCLAGQKTDHLPVSLWRHFPVDDQNPYTLAAETLAFQKTFDLDFVKVTPASSFCLKDWGVEDRWVGNPEGTRDYTRRIIVHPEDWLKLPVLDPTRGALGEQLTCLRLLRESIGPDTPIIQTIFNPLAQAKNLAGQQRLLVHMRRFPQALQAGLERITESTLRFITEAMKTGIDGIFFAVQHAQYGLLSPQEYKTFARVYDLQLLEASQTGWLNVLHLHGDDVMFDYLADYPVQVINWHDRQSTPTLSEGLSKFAGAVCGGISQWETMVLGGNEQVRLQALDALQATGGHRFILGTGCVVPVIAPSGNIRAAVEFARQN